jgi:hypothetical protein
MTERHPNVFEVLIREIGQDGKANVVLGKSLGVLPEPELFEPVCDLLHRGPMFCRALGSPKERIYTKDHIARTGPGRPAVDFGCHPGLWRHPLVADMGGLLYLPGVRLAMASLWVFGAPRPQ